MKNSKVKRFDLGGYASGVQGAYADSLPRKAKKDREDRMALDMQDAIEPVYPETLLLGGAARKGVVAGGRALSNAAKDAVERAVARQSTAESLPTSAALKRALSQRNPKVITSKDKFEEFSGIRGKFKNSKSPEARNKILREEAEEAGIPLREYLKGRGTARAEGVAPGKYWGDYLRFAKGGKVKKYSGKEGSEVKKALGPREQADVKKMESMQRKSKTPIGDIEPVPGHYGDKKYAAGGKVKKMAFGGQTSAPRPTNPFTNPQQYAAEQVAMKPSVAKGNPLSREDVMQKISSAGGKPPYAGPRPGMYGAPKLGSGVSPGIMQGIEKRAIDKISMPPRRPPLPPVPPRKPDMGVLPGYKGPAPTTSAPTTSAPTKPTAGGRVKEGFYFNHDKYGNDYNNPPPPPKPDMGVLPGYKGPAPTTSAPTTSAPTTYKWVNGKAVPVGMKRGGKVGESKKMVKKEVEFFKKKKAPKAMIKHEMGEAKGMKRGGGKVMKFAKGGSIDGCAVRGKTRAKRG